MIQFMCSERKRVMDSDGLAGSLIILAVILIKGFFTACECAIIEISDSRVKGFENESGNKRYLFKILQKPTKLLTAFSLNRIFNAVIISYLSLFYFLRPLAKWFDKMINFAPYNNDDLIIDGISLIALVISLLIIMILSVLAMTIFGDGLPKRMINQNNSEKFAVFCSPAVKLLIYVLMPFIEISSFIVNVLAKIFGLGAKSETDFVTEEEIMMMVDAGNETGVIETSQREMISNIFDFDDIDASDVMTHRTDIIAVDENSSVSDVVNASIESGFSRIPIYSETIDHIIGIICVKDLLCLVGSGAAAEASLKNFVREVIYLPETLSCGEVFKRLTAQKLQLAVIIDEYGGTAGIVTMEDIVESIVGNIQDEYDDDEDEFVKVSDDTFIISGTSEPEEILEQLGIILPDDNDFDTMSGFVVNLLGRIPEENENPIITYEDVRFTVLITEDMCITKLKAEIINNKSKEIQENEEKN